MTPLVPLFFHFFPFTDGRRRVKLRCVTSSRALSIVYDVTPESDRQLNLVIRGNSLMVLRFCSAKAEPLSRLNHEVRNALEWDLQKS